mmetsp:Transcript_3428/g.7367  ORF Transcript_3428/g.7367 Transcript_3428/m.7367 type:complete len:935 (-) Transcript_3428:369-3173(-)
MRLVTIVSLLATVAAGDAEIAAALAPPTSPPPPCSMCHAGHECGICLRLLRQDECPMRVDGSRNGGLLACNDPALPPGVMCEADGPCGTSDQVNNCQYSFSGRSLLGGWSVHTFDVYIRLDCTLQPPSPPTQPPPPSPPPPSLPLPSPPSAPLIAPLVVPAGLVLEEYVNVSTAASKALGVLLTQSSNVIVAAATATATSAVATSVAASAAGGVGGSLNSGVKALQQAQRTSIYSRMGGAPAGGDDGGGGGWTSGRFGFLGDSRRRLQQQDNSSSGNFSAAQGGTTSSEEVAHMVGYAMQDMLVSLLALLGFVIAAHYLLLLWWHLGINREYYARQSARGISVSLEAAPKETEPGAKKAPRPKFRPLPPILRVPALERMLAVTFAPGLLGTSAAVIGAAAAGHPVDAWSVGLASAVTSLIVLFFCSELYTVHRFMRLNNSCWVDAEPARGNAEVDDPIFALLGKLGCLSPRIRGLGAYEPPEADYVEPARTERSLAEAFKPWRLCGLGNTEPRVGDTYEKLQVWLDPAYKGKGVFYLAVQVGLQLVIATFTGLLYANPFTDTPSGGLCISITLIALLVMMMLWTMLTTSNDVYTSIEATLGYGAEVASVCLVLAGNLVAQGAGDDDLSALALSLQLSGAAATILLANMFTGIFIMVYDTFVVPLVRIYWKSELGIMETTCQIVVSLILLPVALVDQFTGGSSAATMLASVTGGLGDGLVNSASRLDASCMDEQSGEASTAKKRCSRSSGYQRRGFSMAESSCSVPVRGAVPATVAAAPVPAPPPAQAASRKVASSEVATLSEADNPMGDRPTAIHRAVMKRMMREEMLWRVRQKQHQALTSQEHVEPDAIVSSSASPTSLKSLITRITHVAHVKRVPAEPPPVNLWQSLLLWIASPLSCVISWIRRRTFEPDKEATSKVPTTSSTSSRSQTASV